MSTKNTLSDRLAGIAILVPFLAVILLLHRSKGVHFDLFIFGSGSWGLACILKLIVYHGFLRKLPHEPDTILGVSALNGLLSGITELGLALLFFALLPELSFWDIVAFGVGIGTIEAFLVATPSSPLNRTSR